MGALLSLSPIFLVIFFSIHAREYDVVRVNESWTRCSSQHPVHLPSVSCAVKATRVPVLSLAEGYLYLW